MQVNQTLGNFEILLRDFITSVLENKLGSDWIKQSGVTDERIKNWESKKLEERKKATSNFVDERIFYYSDFYDLKTIIEKKWDIFSQVFLDKKQTLSFLKIANDFRNPTAHNRSFLPYQESLIIGIIGELTSKIIQSRENKKEKGDFFSQINHVKDNLGNVWEKGDSPGVTSIISIKPDVDLEFVVSASDPDGTGLLYSISDWGAKANWQKSNGLKFKVKEFESANLILAVKIKSDREYQQYGDHDDQVKFYYTVLPF